MNDTLHTPPVNNDTPVDNDPSLVANLPDDDFNPMDSEFNGEDDSDTPLYQLEDFDDESQEPNQPNTPEPQTPTDGDQPPATQDNATPTGGKNWEESAKHFQSETDKLKNTLQGYEQVKPLYDLVTSDPEIAQRVTLAIMNQPQPQSTGEVVAPQGQPAPQATPELVAPVKPDDYDAFEARTNPESASYKFEEQLSEFRVQKAIQSTLEPILGQVNKVNSVLEQQQQAQAYQQQQVAWKRDFMAQGMSATVADNLVGFMSSDASLTPQGWNQFLSGMNQTPDNSNQNPPTDFDQADHASRTNGAGGGGGGPTTPPPTFDSSFKSEAESMDY
jgi:hypothetical protein